METNKPLSGIKVIELTTAVAAPSCGRILAYLGAEVTKIENVSGDAYRQIYTPYLPSESGDAPVYDTLNSQKKSIAANLKNETVNRYVHELLKDCDVFFPNVRNAGLKKLGLDYETLRETNPGLIYGHFSGYGEGGPLAGLPGYDSTAYLARNGVYRSSTVKLTYDVKIRHTVECLKKIRQKVWQ